jgi:beta-galactosidase/beta-glucuronidase
MRPHYQAIVDAYTEVVVNGKPLAESSDLYQFFSVYVHDSLAGFALDNTRTSDPRVLYIGDDNKEKYASLERRKQTTGGEMQTA